MIFSLACAHNIHIRYTFVKHGCHITMIEIAVSPDPTYADITCEFGNISECVFGNVFRTPNGDRIIVIVKYARAKHMLITTLYLTCIPQTVGAPQWRQ